jgi:hypothetical protein
MSDGELRCWITACGPHSVPPAFYKLPRAATADMASRTGSTGQWAGVGSICGLSAYTMNALLGPDRKMRPPKPTFWLVVAHLRQLGTFLVPTCFCSCHLLLLLLPSTLPPFVRSPLLCSNFGSVPPCEAARSYESDHRMSILDVNAFRPRKGRSRWPQMASRMQIHVYVML